MSWRPMTILPSIINVLEKVINFQLKNHLKVNEMLSPEHCHYHVEDDWLLFGSVAIFIHEHAEHPIIANEGGLLQMTAQP